MRHRTAALVLAGCLLALGSGATPFEEGERLYTENQPVKARALLEQALAADPGNPLVYHYLGVIYEQLGDHDRAITIMQRGLNAAGNLRPMFYTNLGNNFTGKGENALADQMYSQAIDLDSAYGEPYLNRANARVSLAKYDEALADYTMYLRLKPTSSRRADVEKMIALLTAHLAGQAAEKRDKEARDRALLDQVLNALKNASEDAQNLSTSKDDTLEERESEIDIKE